MIPAISCDPARLYREGGFSGEPELLDRLLRLGPGAEFVEELFPPYAYPRPIKPSAFDGPADVVAAMIGVLERAGRQGDRGAACGLYRLPRAVLRGGALYVPGPGGVHVLHETYRLADRPVVALAAQAELAGAATPGFRGLQIYLGSSGSFNFGHWIVEDLSRHAALTALRARHPGRTITIVVDGFDWVIDEIRRQSLRLVLGEAQGFEIRFVDRRQSLAFDDLYYPSPTTVHPILKSPEALRGLSELLRRRTRGARLRLGRTRLASALRAGGLPRLGRRLYVMRRQVRTRALVNEPEVADVLARFGFEAVDLETMTFARQMAQFAEAELVIGTMGAAMTGTIACRPGTRVIHLAPEGWTDPFFWDLAAILGHRFGAVFGTPDGPDGDIQRPFRIDPGRLRRYLTDATGELPAGRAAY
jgi:hypothetical protein